MSIEWSDQWSRRRFLGGLTAAGTVSLLRGARPGAAEPPPEITTIRLVQTPSVCQAPQYVAEELLQVEGFAEIRYTKIEGGGFRPLAAGDVDLTMTMVAPLVARVDAGDPVVILAGGHVGCFELFGGERVRAIRDLRGKTIAVRERGTTEDLFLSVILAYVGMDPRRDVNWVTLTPADAIRRLTEGQVDAFLAFPPAAQELRARKVGHVVLNSTLDRPWSQYFCCMVAGNREFVRKHPVATKRALRAILKAADVCFLEPERVARDLVARGFTQHQEYALQALREIPYLRWRELESEDSVRFYALRLHEAGLIKSSPQKILAQGTDWRFLRELKKELKG